MMDRLRIRRVLSALSMVLLVALLTACGGSGGDGDSTTYGDQPTTSSGDIAIVLSSGINKNGTTSNSAFPVAGSIINLSEQSMPEQVSWTLSTPDASAALSNVDAGVFAVSATGEWSGTINLQPGDNQITLSIQDIEAAVDLYITYNPDYDFGGTLILTPDVAYVEEDRVVTATISLTDEDTDPADVKLVRVETTETEVVDMLDDGACAAGDCPSDASGDEIAGDNVYTGRFTINEASATTVVYRVVVGLTYSSDPARSENFELTITQHLTDAKLDELLAKQSEYQNQLETAAEQAEVSEVIENIIAELENDPEVAQVGKSNGGHGVWIIYNDGVGGVLYTPLSGSKGGRQRPLDEPSRSESTQSSLNRLVDYPPYKGYPPKMANNLFQANVISLNDNVNRIESNKARVIAAQYFDWGENDDIPQMKALLDDSCFDVNYTTYNAAGAGSVEDFKNLDDYGIILISSHGDSYYKGILSLWQEKFGWDWPFGIVILHSNMAVTATNKVTYEDDLKKGRLVLWGSNYGMTPKFIEKYSSNFPNSLVYMSICRGTWNASMANAFLSAGASAYLGYSDYVAVSFCVAHGPPLLEGLLEPGKTLSDVFVAGQVETDSDPAEFKMFGEDSLSLELEGLLDGSFESGAISQAWTVEGDGRIVTGLGSDSPTDGTYMGIISTGLGYTTDSGSVSQTICLSDNVGKLVFDWNFFSEEFKEYCNTQFDDTFQVSVTDLETDTETVLFITSVNILCGNTDVLIDSPVDFDQGDAWYTGWNADEEVDISAYRGDSVVLKFFATDKGDSIFDTAILIDDIKIIEEE